MKRLKKARGLAGITNWPRNAMRHSFASHGYHLGLEWCVKTLRHTDGFRIFRKHYRGIVEKKAATAYFQILPN